MQLNKSKIAIVHDSFTYFGGAERVLLNFIKIFPKADIYTSILTSSGLKLLKQKTKGKINYLLLTNFKPLKENPSLLKIFVLLYWQRINLNSYDFVISSSGSFSSNWIKTKGKHISYIYTPPRYLYDEFSEMTILKKFPFKQLFFPILKIIKIIDYGKLQKVDLLIAASKNIRRRIKNYYNRDSIVIYPPIDNFNNPKDNKSKKYYYIFFSRLVKQKGGELAIRSFNINGKKLIVIGVGKEFAKLKKIAKKNITFKKYLSDKQLIKVFSKARALIYCSIDEDFGMIPLEAMKSGVPVIAYKSGGTKETILENKTGIFFNEYTTTSLNAAIGKFEKTFEKTTSYLQNCIKWSKQFDRNTFRLRLIENVKKLYSQT